MCMHLNAVSCLLVAPLVTFARAPALPVTRRAVAAARKAFDEGPWPRMGGKNRGKVRLRAFRLQGEASRAQVPCSPPSLTLQLALCPRWPTPCSPHPSVHQSSLYTSFQDHVP